MCPKWILKYFAFDTTNYTYKRNVRFMNVFFITYER